MVPPARRGMTMRMDSSHLPLGLRLWDRLYLLPYYNTRLRSPFSAALQPMLPPTVRCQPCSSPRVVRDLARMFIRPPVPVLRHSTYSLVLWASLPSTR